MGDGGWGMVMPGRTRIVPVPGWGAGVVVGGGRPIAGSAPGTTGGLGQAPVGGQSSERGLRVRCCSELDFNNQPAQPFYFHCLFTAMEDH
jgi:hypothetical protein